MRRALALVGLASACGSDPSGAELARLQREIAEYCGLLPIPYRTLVSDVESGRYGALMEHWASNSVVSNLHTQMRFCLDVAQLASPHDRDSYGVLHGEIGQLILQVTRPDGSGNTEASRQALAAKLTATLDLAEQVAKALHARPPKK